MRVLIVRAGIAELERAAASDAYQAATRRSGGQRRRRGMTCWPSSRRGDADLRHRRCARQIRRQPPALTRRPVADPARGGARRAARNGRAHHAAVEYGEEVEAFADTRSPGRFDLVVGADGIHSAVRRHVAGEVEMRPTGWGGWVWWAPAAAAPHKTVSEYWGAGRFVGIHP